MAKSLNWRMPVFQEMPMVLLESSIHLPLAAVALEISCFVVAGHQTQIVVDVTPEAQHDNH